MKIWLFCLWASENPTYGYLRGELGFETFQNLKVFLKKKNVVLRKPYCRNLGSLVPAVCTVTKKYMTLIASKDHKDAERARLMNILYKTSFNNEH